MQGTDIQRHWQILQKTAAIPYMDAIIAGAGATSTEVDPKFCLQATDIGPLRGLCNF